MITIESPQDVTKLKGCFITSALLDGVGLVLTLQEPDEHSHTVLRITAAHQVSVTNGVVTVAPNLHLQCTPATAAPE